ncbi:MAG: hypothetical protein ACI4V2_05575, partial [Alloprevotella sp.]
KGNEKRWAKKDKAKNKNEYTSPIPKAAPIPKADPIPTELSTDNNAEYLTHFFRAENKANVEVVLLNLGFKPSDTPRLHKLADEVIAEWRATDTHHEDYNDFARHLISTIRIKLNSQKTAKNEKSNNPRRPTHQLTAQPEDYTGTF